MFRNVSIRDNYRVISIIYTFFLLGVSFPISAQVVIIDSIHIAGNTKTNDFVIQRELPFKLQDTISLSSLPEQLVIARERLLYTYLFKNAHLNISHLEYDEKVGIGYVKITISVEERFFILFRPIAEIADRNFNVWWKEYDASLARINVGFAISHLNITENKDYLRLKTQIGFTSKLEFDYFIPGTVRHPNFGIALSGKYSQSKRVRFNTIDNKEIFHKSEENQQYHRTLGIRLIRRFRLYNKVSIGAEFIHKKIKDSVAILNPYFFGEGRVQQSYLSMHAKWVYDNRDDFLLPSKGIYLSAIFSHQGLLPRSEIHISSIEGKFEMSFSRNKWYFSTGLKALFRYSKERIPYANIQAIGYRDDVISGYHLYLIDGKDFIIHQNVLRYNIFNYTFVFGKIMPVRAFRKMPFKVFLSFAYDHGWSNNKQFQFQNSFANRYLFGFGPSIDILYQRSFLGSIQFAWNHLGEGGIFFNVTSPL